MDSGSHRIGVALNAALCVVLHNNASEERTGCQMIECAS